MKQAIAMSIVVVWIITMMVSVIPPADAVEGEDTYTLHVWVKNSVGTGLNNATVSLKEQGIDDFGGDVVQSGTTSSYTALVDNETIGTGDGVEKIFYVSGTPVVDWTGDDTIDDDDVLIYNNSVFQAIADFDFSETTGKITFIGAPADGNPITATYRWNAGAGHIQFNNVPAGKYVVKTELDDYITEYDDIDVYGDTTHIVEMYEWDEAHKALGAGNPTMYLGTAFAIVVTLAGVAKARGVI